MFASAGARELFVKYKMGVAFLKIKIVLFQMARLRFPKVSQKGNTRFRVSVAVAKLAANLKNPT